MPAFALLNTNTVGSWSVTLSTEDGTKLKWEHEGTKPALGSTWYVRVEDDTVIGAVQQPDASHPVKAAVQSVARGVGSRTPMGVPRYRLHDEGGAYIRDPRYIPEMTEAEKIAETLPPPVCLGAPLDIDKPDSCLTRDLEQRFRSDIELIKRAQAQNIDLCPGAQGAPPMQLGLHQRSVFELAKAMATRTNEELNGSRGLLVFHNVGSGKTATALGIMLAFMFAKPKRRIVFATTPDNMRDNSMAVYAKNLFLFYPQYASMVFGKVQLPDKPWTPEREKVLEAWCGVKANVAGLESKVRILSFTTLASQLCLEKGEGGIGLGEGRAEGMRLLVGKHGGQCDSHAHGPHRALNMLGKGGEGAYEGSVLIMDEVQSLFTPQDSYKRAVGHIVPILMDARVQEHMMCFALTGTPGNTVKDMVQVLNIVRRRGQKLLTEADIQRAPRNFAGLVSYAEISGDTSKYGKKIVENVYVPMDERYYVGYLRTIGHRLSEKELSFQGSKKRELSGTPMTPSGMHEDKGIAFLAKPKAAGDTIAKTAVTGVISPAELDRLASREGAHGVVKVVKIGNQVRILSDKLRLAIENCMKMPGKQYMYVSDAATAKVVAAALHNMGYTPISAKDFSVHGGALQPGPKLQGAAKRFMLYRSGSTTMAHGKEELGPRELKAQKSYFNARTNDGGAMCKILLATGTYYQGVDTRALQGVHIVDQLFNFSADRQAVGRGLRLCGHSTRASDPHLIPSRQVRIIRYFSVPPRRFDIHEFADGLKGQARTKLLGLEPLARQLLSIPDRNIVHSLPHVDGLNVSKLEPGVNSYAFIDAVRRGRDVVQFENLLKAFAVDCRVFKNIFHSGESFQCGVAPRVVRDRSSATARPWGSATPTPHSPSPSPTPRSPSPSPRSSRSPTPRSTFRPPHHEFGTPSLSPSPSPSPSRHSPASSLYHSSHDPMDEYTPSPPHSRPREHYPSRASHSSVAERRHASRDATETGSVRRPPSPMNWRGHRASLPRHKVWSDGVHFPPEGEFDRRASAPGVLGTKPMPARPRHTSERKRKAHHIDTPSERARINNDLLRRLERAEAMRHKRHRTAMHVSRNP